jgi:hypothetical protein
MRRVYCLQEWLCETSPIGVMSAFSAVMCTVLLSAVVVWNYVIMFSVLILNGAEHTILEIKQYCVNLFC